MMKTNGSEDIPPYIFFCEHSERIIELNMLICYLTSTIFTNREIPLTEMIFLYCNSKV